MERLRALLPPKLRDRTITYIALAVSWPLVPAVLSLAFFAIYDQLRPGLLSVTLYFSVLVPSIVASGLGAAFILLATPICSWARIAVSISGGIAALLAFGLYQVAVGVLLGFPLS
jgi:hypothetical protein